MHTIPIDQTYKSTMVIVFIFNSIERSNSMSYMPSTSDSLTNSISVSKADKALRSAILSNSSSETRPISNFSKPIIIKIGIELKQLISLDERSQQINVKLWLRMKWLNEFMEWEPQKWSNIRNVKVDSRAVWVPDLTLHNDIDDQQNSGRDKFKTRVTVASNGSSQWNAPGVFRSTCNIDVKYFPFDVQRCVLVFGSLDYNEVELQFTKDSSPIVTREYQNSSEWDLIDFEVRIDSVQHPCCDIPYHDVTFRFIIHRKPLFYVINIILPCSILMIIVLFSFFLPPDSGERISLVITVLLAFTVFLQMMNSSLPKNSDTTPVLSTFYVTVMTESTMSLITTCIVLIAHHRGEERWSEPLPSWVNKWFFEKIAAVLCVHSVDAQEIKFEETSTAIGLKHGNNIFHEDSIDSQCNNSPSVSTSSIDEYSERVDPLSYIRPISSNRLDAILKELRHMTSSISDSRAQDKNEADWRLLSNVLDRLFFLVFVCLFTLSSLSILLPAYYSHEREIHHANST